MKILIGILLLIINVIVDVFAFKMIWAWLIIPSYDLPMISTPAIVAIFLLVALTAHQTRPKDSLDDIPEMIVHGINVLIIHPGLMLVVAFITKIIYF